MIWVVSSPAVANLNPDLLRELSMSSVSATISVPPSVSHSLFLCYSLSLGFSVSLFFSCFAALSLCPSLFLSFARSFSPVASFSLSLPHVLLVPTYASHAFLSGFIRCLSADQA